MTANQIAYAALLEEGRHNASVEVETAKANRERERISQEANNIEAGKAAEVARHDKQTEEIQAKYNELTIELQTAQGNRRLEIEQELANVKQQEADNNAEYQRRMAEIGEHQNEIQAMREFENQRHNQEMETIQRLNIQNDFILRNKQIEYQNTFNREQVNNLFRNYLLENKKVQLQEQQFLFQNEKLKAETQQIQVKTGLMPWDSLYNGFGSVLGAGAKYLPFM